jgi:hypothetical protein
MQISDCACEGCTLVFEGKSREMNHLCNGYTNKKKHFDVQALCDFVTFGGVSRSEFTASSIMPSVFC